MNIKILLTLVQVLLAVSALLVYMRTGSDLAAWSFGFLSGIVAASVVRWLVNRK